MSEPVLIALITTIGALVTGVIVEMIRRQRRDQKTNDQKLDSVIAQLNPNSGKSMHHAVIRIENDVREVRKTQREQGERLSAVEARVSDHLSRS